MFILKPYFNFLFLSIVALIFVSGCRRIQVDGPTGSMPASPLPKANSQIHLGIEIPVSYLEKTLNNNLDNLLYAEDALPIGDGLFADLTINKNGMLKLESGNEGNLLVSMPVFLAGKLKLEKKIFGQMISTALPFREPLSPKISFKPSLKPDWSFEIEDLEIESWGRPMQFDLLGYNIDFEPMVKKRLLKIMEDQLKNGVLAEMNFKSLAQTTWNAYSKPIHLNYGMGDNYLYTIPQTLKINEYFTADQHLMINIGLEGEVERRAEGPVDSTFSKLPELLLEEVKGNFLDITLPLSINYEQIDEYLNKELVEIPIKIDSKTTLIPHAFSTGHYGDKALVEMKFTAKRVNKKDIEGEIYLVGNPVYDPEAQAIVFTGVDFDINTESFYANTARWLKKRKIRNAIQRKAIFPIGNYLEDAKAEVHQMGVWQTSFAAMGLENTELSVDGIYPTEKDITIFLKTKGDIQVTWQQ